VITSIKDIMILSYYSKIFLSVDPFEFVP
jgi:hypothetical protein